MLVQCLWTTAEQRVHDREKEPGKTAFQHTRHAE
jgi:hypothetical protein